MSDAKICDRCGQTIKLFEHEPDKDEAWRYEVIKDCYPYPDELKIDLCKDCKKRFDEMVRDKKKVRISNEKM